LKSIKCFVLILLFLFGFHIASAQKTNSVRQEVINRLNKIKPPNTKNYVYKVIVPVKFSALPENLQLDFVYKIGHYEFEYVALRFEKKRNEDFVTVTRFVYGSALNFWKEYSKYAKGDAYPTEQVKLPVKDFNEMLNLAYTYYQSDIVKEYIELKTTKCRLKDGKLTGTCFGSGIGSVSSSWSSGDGSIAIRLSDTLAKSDSIINEKGTLYPGDLKSRSSDGYQKLRVHLFWEVFYQYFEKNNIFTALDNQTAEEIAISRLNETPFDRSYTDYYRQSLYVEILGEIGTAKALPVLKKLAKTNGLEKDWDKYLSQDAEKAIEKIKLREKIQAE
jgi:hypothetical protein